MFNRRQGRTWRAMNSLVEGMAVPILVQKDGNSSFSRASASSLAILLRNLDADRATQKETELLWYFVISLLFFQRRFLLCAFWRRQCYGCKRSWFSLRTWNNLLCAFFSSNYHMKKTLLTSFLVGPQVLGFLDKQSSSPWIVKSRRLWKHATCLIQLLYNSPWAKYLGDKFVIMLGVFARKDLKLFHNVVKLTENADL